MRQPVADFYAPLPRGWDDRPSSPVRPPLQQRASEASLSVEVEDSLMLDGEGESNPFCDNRTASAAAVPLPVADDVDMDLDDSDSPVLLEKPAPSPSLSTESQERFAGPQTEMVFTRDDGDFVEVSRA